MFLVYPNEYVVTSQMVFNAYYFSLFILEFATLMVVMGGMALVAEGAWIELPAA